MDFAMFASPALFRVPCSGSFLFDELFMAANRECH